jgi:hypothetical protein
MPTTQAPDQSSPGSIGSVHCRRRRRRHAFPSASCISHRIRAMAPTMSNRMRPPWLKKMKRIIGRRLRSGSLSTEAARQLCDEVLPSIQRHSPPPAVSAAADVSRADRRPSWELEQFVG